MWIPWEVVTNEMPRGPASTLSLSVASPEVRSKAENSAALLLDWLVHPRLDVGEHLDALLAATMLRSRSRVSPMSVVAVNRLRGLTAIDAMLGTDASQNEEEILDKLLALLSEKLAPAP